MSIIPKNMLSSFYGSLPDALQRFIAGGCSMLPHRFNYGKAYVEIKKLLETTKHYNREQIKEFQFRRFLSIYKHAIRNIPFYRKFYGEFGLNENSVKSPGDIPKIPTLNKAIVRKNVDDFLWPSFPKNKILITKTGGSTGVPLKLFRPDFTHQIHKAFNDHIWKRAGHRPDDFKIIFARSVYLKAKDGIFQFYHPKHNYLCLAIDNIDKKTAEKYIEIFYKKKPKFFVGYSGTIFSFTQIIREQKKIAPKLNGIFPHSQKLLPGQREILQNFYGGRVFMHYGLAERVILAAECEYSHDYHVVPEFGYAELLDSQGQVIKSPNVVGELAGTGFYNKIMPLIRYRTGDQSEYCENQTCECGRPHDILSNLIGRTQDFLVLKDGTFKGVAAGAHAFFILADYCRGYQLYQEVPGKIEVRIIPKSDNPPDYLEIVRKELKNKYFGPLDFEIVVTDKLEKSISEKQKYLIQKLKTPSNNEEIVMQ